MIAFCMGGGIGDAILCVPVIRRMQSTFDEPIVVFYCDGNLTPILGTIPDVELRFFETYWWDSQLECVKNAVSDCSLIIWNRFESDNDEKCNYFYANDEKWLPFVRMKREEYRRNLSSELGREIGDLEEEVSRGLMFELSGDSNFYSDWNRFGIDVSYDDVHMDIPVEFEEKHAGAISKLGPYAILHDSRLPEDGKSRPHWIKCWYTERWNQLSSHLSSEYGLCVVQMRSDLSPMFSGTICHEDIIGGDATFFDYLTLVKNSSLYVGTDSWPAHAAVFLKNPVFVILKGPSVRRWDHFNRYASILRKGNCQGCEYISLDDCIFGSGARWCMDSIGIEDVKKVIRNSMNASRTIFLSPNKGC